MLNLIRKQWAYFTYANKPDFNGEVRDIIMKEERSKRNVDFIIDHNEKFQAEMECIDVTSERIRALIDDYYKKVGKSIIFFGVPFEIFMAFIMPAILVALMT